MSAHTPGPWRWSDETDNLHPQRAYDEAAKRAAAQGMEGCDPEESIIVTDSGYYPPRGADRLLIAAAPELLEAARLTLSCLQRNLADEACTFMGDDEHEAIAALLRAIAKATLP